jgi:TolB-like protein
MRIRIHSSGFLLANFAVICLMLPQHSFAVDAGRAPTAIAVIDIENRAGLTSEEAEVFSEVLRTELVKTDRFTVLERKDMAFILKEQGFQQSGACSDASCIVEVGKLLAVQKMVGGAIGKIGNSYSINLKIIDVQTGAIVKIVTEDARGSKEKLLTETLRSAARRLAGIEADKKTPWFAHWFIVAPAAVCVAGGVAAAVLLSQPKASEPGPSPGNETNPETDNTTIPVIITFDQ